MRDTGALRWTAILTLLAVTAGACGGAGPATPAPTPGSAVSGGGDTPPETLELGHEYRYVVPDDATGPARFVFEAPPSSIVQVEATADAGNRSQIGLDAQVPAGLGPGLSLHPGQSDSTRPWIHSDTGGGRWVLDILGVGGDAVTFTVTAPLQADAGGSGDAGGHAGTAVTIQPKDPVSGVLGNEDQEDWYALSLGGGDVVTVNLDVPASEIGAVSATIVFNGSRLSSAQANPGGTASFTQVFAQDQTGTAQIQVIGNSAYQFSVESGPQRDGGSDGDAGGNLSDAKPVDFGTIEGVLGGEDREDFYLLALPVDAVIRMEATFAPDAVGGGRIEVIHNGRNIMNRNIAAGATEKFLYGLINPADAPAYIRVAATGTASYSLTIEAATQPDGDGTGDAGGDRSQAKEVEPTGSFQGILNNRSADDNDWYRFEATADGTLQIEIAIDAAGELQTRMLVWDGNRRVGDVRTGPGGTNTVSFEATAGKVYHIELGAGGLAPYTISFEAA